MERRKANKVYLLLMLDPSEWNIGTYLTQAQGGIEDLLSGQTMPCHVLHAWLAGSGQAAPRSL